MRDRFLDKFKRITYSTAYLPEIDGLRFLAIFMVVVIMHSSHFIDEKYYGGTLAGHGYWSRFIMEGGSGVPLFFIISGFILSLPFAKWRLKGAKEVNLGKYFLRRVTRLEPPYLIALVIYFLAHLFVVRQYELSTLFPHFLASVFYSHTIIYHSFPLVLPVAWSLEVEVQFYILAPLFCLLFILKNTMARRIIFIVIIIASALYWFDVWKVSHVFMYLHYFFSGILLADLHAERKALLGQKAGAIAGLLSLAGFLFLPSIGFLPGYLLKICCMFFLVHTVLTNALMKRLFSVPILVVIGGMCYSIYLLHFAIISFAGQLLPRTGLDVQNHLFFIPIMLFFSAAVLIVSSIYFLLVEKPFMMPRGLGQKKKLPVPDTH